MYQGRAGYTHASFSKVTAADLDAFGSLEIGATEREVIFPLYSRRCQDGLYRMGMRWFSIPEAEKVLDFLVRGFWGNTRDVDGGSLRHGGEEGFMLYG